MLYYPFKNMFPFYSLALPHSPPPLKDVQFYVLCVYIFICFQYIFAYNQATFVNHFHVWFDY